MNGLLSIIRNALLLLSGFVVQHGWMTDSEWEQVVGAIIIVGVAAWKWWINRKRTQPT